MLWKRLGAMPWSSWTIISKLDSGNAVQPLGRRQPGGENAAWLLGRNQKKQGGEKMQTYPGMNKKLVGLLRLSDDPKDLLRREVA